MGQRRYVQHISGHGEKWEVKADNKAGYSVMSPLTGAMFTFPKSEYSLCEPPDEWRDATNELQIVTSGSNFLGSIMDSENQVILELTNLHGVGKYRPRKLESPYGYSFIVERKVS